LLRLVIYFPDFGISRKVPWHIALRRLRYAKVAHTIALTANIRHLVFCANCHKSVIHFSRLWLFAQWLCDLGIPQPAQSPSLSKIRRIWRPGFYIDGCTILWALAKIRQIFKQKKGSATISLGLIYYSMVLSQPPSRDTVFNVLFCTY
jgi:hypothetical protein